MRPQVGEHCVKDTKEEECSRLNKTGGGVALYINETLQPNYLPNKSKCIDNCAEIVTVEVTLATGKKVLVSCA